ncbi:diacylglycerol kinase family lipid kinase [Phaeovibrio sulfidiphilus]|uniref:Diacylglycerol kinase family lipid kinase n=1 Tax=Phaeovibrio sulfidiphilus TaxID=1220600 RepID=A0A8J7CCW4_9PROT|nr:diacylglycerol kinase family protein [Phaeovibrio sulfidiphilus]MBE1236244.1 diacylglycerol kinase family lipid kinase [Phaeovibrio sulfidiphilus]
MECCSDARDPGACAGASGSPRRLLVIANPTAGTARKAILRRVLDDVRALGATADVRYTECAGDGVRLAGAAAREGRYDVIVAAGGDGTVNEVANGLARAGCPGVALGILPLGTANVLAIEAGIPRDPAGAARILVQGVERPLYLGVARCAPPDSAGHSGEARRFVMMAGVGFDAHVVGTVSPSLKRVGGKLAYVWSALRGAFTYGFPLCSLEIETPQGDWQRFRAASAVFCKGRHYGGAFVVAPGADLSRPELEVLILERPGPLNCLRYAWGLALGRLDRFPDVRIVSARSVRLHGLEREGAQIDGDACPGALSGVSVDPVPLRLVVPAAGGSRTG